MERKQPDGWGGEWFGYTAVIAFYELVGTAMLVAIINATGGNAAAIGLGLLYLLTIGAQISGAHYNPAVTIGVFINRTFCMPTSDSSNSVAKNFVQAVCMIIAQVLGGLIGAGAIYGMVANKSSSAAVRAAQFPHLMPQGISWW